MLPLRMKTGKRRKIIIEIRYTFTKLSLFKFKLFG